MSEVKYLDKLGLGYFWGKIKARYDSKADKVSSPTAGHFASLNAQGNLQDSGKSASDFAPSDIGLTVVDGKVCQTFDQ